MKRELLFRAMVLKHFTYAKKNYAPGDMFHFSIVTDIGYLVKNEFIDEETIGQWSGEEIEGEKVYEGDIVKAFGVYMEWKIVAFAGTDFYQYGKDGYKDPVRGTKILGNIYQNQKMYDSILQSMKDYSYNLLKDIK